MPKSNPWTQQEQKLILENYQSFNSKKWKNIASILCLKGYQRSEIECRQRYVNYLDPELAKTNDMTEENLKTLYDQYQEHGPKWCLIQKSIPNRTQIKLKNVFYGNIRLFLKKLYRYFTQKTAVFVNDLKTDDLQSLYDGTQQFKGFSLIKKAFKKLNYKITQQNCFEAISQNQTEFLSILNKLLVYKTKIKPLKSLNSSQDKIDIQKKRIKAKMSIKESKLQNVIQIQKSPFSDRKKQGAISQLKFEGSVANSTPDLQELNYKQKQLPFLSNIELTAQNMIYPYFNGLHPSQIPIWVPFYPATPLWGPSAIKIWPAYQNTYQIDEKNMIRCKQKQEIHHQAAIQAQKCINE